MSKATFLFVLLAVCTDTYAQQLLGFIENKGQIYDQHHRPNPTVKYLLNQKGCNIQLRQTGFSYDTYIEKHIKEDNVSVSNSEEQFLLEYSNRKKPTQTNRFYHRVDIELINANSQAELLAEEPFSDYLSFYNAVTPESGATHVRHYRKITYKNIYLHIDLVFTIQETVKYDFIVHPGGKVEDIQLSYQGMNQLKAPASGGLTITVEQGILTEEIPKSYLKENELEVTVSYKLIANDKVKFNVPSYDHRKTLVIDPTPNLDWGTYYGGSEEEWGIGIDTDNNNNVLLGGWTVSTTAIATAGAYQTTFAGGAGLDAYIAKFNNNGVRQWGTYYGGIGDDRAFGIAVDGNSNVVLVGYTTSTTAMTTAGAHQPVSGGGRDAFVIKLDANGVRQWGTYYGGNNNDWGYGVSTDNNNNVLITGRSRSTNAIATAGAHQPAHGGGSDDAFIVKFDASGVRQWSTYYGGSGIDQGSSIATDITGNILITGFTRSTTSIGTTGAYQPTYVGGTTDAYIVKFDASGVRQWGTYYGGNGASSWIEYGTGITSDGSGNVLVTGYTNSTTNIATAGAYQTTIGGSPGPFDAYIVKFDANGIRQWCTYYGGTGDEQSFGIATDNCDNVLITGYTSSTNAIATTGAYQTVYGGGPLDSYAAKFDANGVIQWGTYYGGSGQDNGYSITADNTSKIFITGNTESTNAIASAGAHQITNGGGTYDAFVAKLSSDITISSIGGVVCSGNCVTLTATSNGGTSPLTYTWSPNIGTGLGPYVVCPSSTTIYTITITDACNNTNTDTVVVTVNQQPSVTVTGVTTICFGINTTLTASGGVNYSWVPAGQTTTSIVVSPATNSTYTVITADSSGGCTDTLAVSVQVEPLPFANAGPDISMCAGSSATLNASGNGSFSWSPSTGLNNTAIANPVASPTSIITYTLAVTNYCGTAIDTMTITTPALPSANAGADITICPGSNTTLSGNGAGTFTWSGSGNLSCISCQNPVASPNATTTYTLTISDVCGSASDSITVTIANPIISISGTTTICNGNSATLTASGTISYSWLPSGQTTANIVISPPTGTTVYAVTGTDANGCTNTNTTTVTVNSQPTISLSGNTTICNGSNTTLSASGGVNYNWSPGGQTTTSITVNPAITTSYSVIVSNGLCTDTAATIVTVAPNIIASIAGNNIICIGYATTLTASGGTNYLWSTGAITNTVVVSPATTASYSVIVTNGVCVDSATINVIVNPLPAASITGNTTVCSGSSVMLTASGGINYLWSNGAITTAIAVSPISSSGYTVTVTDINGCTQTASVMVTTSNGPIIMLSSQTNISCNAGNDGSATVNAISGIAPYTYLWNTNPLQNAATANGLSAGNYVVMVTDAINCSSTHTVLINEPSAIAITIYDTQTNCDDSIGVAIATASGGTGAFTYAWNPTNQTTQTVTGLAAGNYTVTILDANSCMKNAMVEISESLCPCPSDNLILPLPNAFSPNGDGENDVFCLSAVQAGWDYCIRELTIFIYNRWGERVYESENPKFCWDGTYKGKVEGTAVFVYSLEATLISGKKITKSGNISLIQ